MWAGLTKHWFLASLAVCFSVGFFFAEPLQWLLELTWLRNAIVFFVMWATAINLRADTIRRSIAFPFPSLLAIAINVIAVPLLCLPWMMVLPEPLFGGLFVTSIVPCSLASASVWTRRAGGDDSIAIMTTVFTNLACVIVVPIGIYAVLAHQAEIDLDDQVKKLAWLVVLPVVLAQAMRRLGAAAWTDRIRPRLSAGGQLGILAMVVFGSVASGSSFSGGQGAGGVFLLLSGPGLLLSAVAVHCASLGLGIVSAKAAGMGRESQIAIGIAGSQKTLMIGLQIAIDCGVSVIPMIVYHLSQLVIDTLVADYWRGRNRVVQSDLDDSNRGGSKRVGPTSRDVES